MVQVLEVEDGMGDMAVVMAAEAVVVEVKVRLVEVLRTTPGLLVGWSVVTAGGADVLGAELAVVMDSRRVTLLQDLQHMRWKLGREQWRISASMRQNTVRSPWQR